MDLHFLGALGTPAADPDGDGSTPYCFVMPCRDLRTPRDTIVLFQKMIHDSISDLFTRIRNASLVCQDKVRVPYNKINKQIIQILLQQGFIREFKEITTASRLSLTKAKAHDPIRGAPAFVLTLKYEKNTPVILKLQRLSRPSCRLYVKVQNIPKIFRKNQLSVIFLSTSQGILSDREAYRLKLGGEILGFVS